MFVVPLTEFVMLTLSPVKLNVELLFIVFPSPVKFKTEVSLILNVEKLPVATNT